MRNWITYILPFSFLGFLFLMFFGQLITGPRETLWAEKRLASLAPSFPESINSKTLSTFTKDYSSYVDDQLLLRNTLLRLNSILHLEVFNCSPIPEKVIVGKENWLFFALRENLETAVPTRYYSNEELMQFAASLYQQKEVLNRMGISYYVLICPSKPGIYDQYLPDQFQKPNEQITKTQQLVQFLKNLKDLHVIYPAELIKNKSKKKQLYLTYDSHWNTHGAFFAYQSLMDSLLANGVDVYKHNSSTVKYQSYHKSDLDLLTMLNLEGYRITKEEQPTFSDTLKTEMASSEKYKDLSLFPHEFWKSNVSNNTKVLFFHDSYMVHMRPYFINSFKNSSYLWTPLLYRHVIEQEKPNVVVHQIVERRIDDLKIGMLD